MNIIYKKSFVILVAILICICALIIPRAIGANNTKVISMHGDLSKSYKSVDELKKEADLIAEVKIEDTSPFTYHDVVFTLSDAYVNKAFKGNPGSKIKILETGGVIGNKSYIFEDNPVFSSKERAIVFLQRYTGPVSKDSYVILGVYEGKFKYSNGNSLIPPRTKEIQLNTINKLADLGL